MTPSGVPNDLEGKENGMRDNIEMKERDHLDKHQHSYSSNSLSPWPTRHSSYNATGTLKETHGRSLTIGTSFSHGLDAELTKSPAFRAHRSQTRLFGCDSDEDDEICENEMAERNLSAHDLGTLFAEQSEQRSSLKNLSDSPPPQNRHTSKRRSLGRTASADLNAFGRSFTFDSRENSLTREQQQQQPQTSISLPKLPDEEPEKTRIHMRRKTATGVGLPRSAASMGLANASHSPWIPRTRSKDPNETNPFVDQNWNGSPRKKILSMDNISFVAPNNAPQVSRSTGNLVLEEEKKLGRARAASVRSRHSANLPPPSPSISSARPLASAFAPQRGLARKSLGNTTNLPILSVSPQVHGHPDTPAKPTSYLVRTHTQPLASYVGDSTDGDSPELQTGNPNMPPPTVLRPSVSSNRARTSHLSPTDDSNRLSPNTTLNSADEDGVPSPTLGLGAARLKKDGMTAADGRMSLLKRSSAMALRHAFRAAGANLAVRKEPSTPSRDQMEEHAPPTVPISHVTDETPTPHSNLRAARPLNFYNVPTQKSPYSQVSRLSTSPLSVSTVGTSMFSQTRSVSTSTTTKQSRFSRMKIPGFRSASSSLTASRPTSPLSRVVREAEGRFLREFVVLNALGGGAFSSVFSVQSRSDGRVYAAKRSLRPFEGVKDRQRQVEEPEILARVAGHPHVLQLIDAWEEGARLFVLTNICEMGSLDQFLNAVSEQEMRLDEARVWKIFAQLASGIAYIHSKGVIHLDLKPANIFINSEGSLQIGDFGMALFDSAERGAQGRDTEGDRCYIAPELLHGRLSYQADVFSLGIMLLEIACNIVVPDGGDPWHRLRNDDFSDCPLNEISADTPLVEIIMWLLQSNPNSRPRSEQLALYPLIVVLGDMKRPAVGEEDENFLADAVTIAHRMTDEFDRNLMITPRESSDMQCDEQLEMAHDLSEDYSDMHGRRQRTIITRSSSAATAPMSDIDVHA